MKTAASIPTSKTLPAASPWTASLRLRPTPCSRWAAIPATKTRRASCSPSWTRQRPAPTSSKRPASPAACPMAMASGRGGLLLRRRHRQLPAHRLARDPRRRALLRPAAARQRGGEDQGAPADPRRREGRAHPRRLARLRSRPQGQQGRLPIFRLPRHRARLQQRHHPPLRSRRRQAGLAAHDGFLQGQAGLTRNLPRHEGRHRLHAAPAFFCTTRTRTTIMTKQRKRLTFWGADEHDDSLPREVMAGRKTVTADTVADYYKPYG